jgi:type IV pilus assembly protein PilQ
MTKRSTSVGGHRFARIGAVCAACALLATPALAQKSGKKDGAGAGPSVNMSESGTVDLAVQDTDLGQVLEMLSIQGHKNIIASPSVKATVSANLYDVTFYEALDAILTLNGFSYYEEGNFIYVMTQEELVEMQKATRATETRIFELDYLSAGDAKEFITPLLSEAGKASTRGDVQAGFQPDISDGGADSYAYNAKIVVNDYPENLDAITKLLADLDTPPQQVLVEATIVQTTLDEANAYGVDFSVIADMDFLDLTNPLAPVTNLLAGDDPTRGFQPPDNKAGGLQSTVGTTAGAGGFKVGVVTDEISVFLKLLDEVTDVSVLARPKIMALNRQRAEVLVGARVGYLSTTATQTTTTQTVQFLDTGIHLTFRPFISKNGMIRMELSPSVSEASLRNVTDAQGLQVTIPDELTNELTTNVRVQDGQTLVLGGLFRESIRVTRRQVPFLGDIPILNLAFRGQDDVVDRDEIIFLITPSIVNDEALWDIGDDAMRQTDAVIIGARAGLLPFSREQVISKYNGRAVDAFRAGNLNMAMHWANVSLGVDRNQPTMVMLRNEISGKHEQAFDGSLLEHAVRRELGPLPKARSEMPREVAGAAGAVGAPLNMLPGFSKPSPFTAPSRDRDVPENLEGPGAAAGADNGPVSSATGDRWQSRPMTNVPHVPRPAYWPAGAATGFDDPAWSQSRPFVTFEEAAPGASL